MQTKHRATHTGEGYFTKCLVGKGPPHDEKMDSIGSNFLVKIRGQKDLRTMKKEENKIKNQGEN